VVVRFCRWCVSWGVGLLCFWWGFFFFFFFCDSASIFLSSVSSLSLIYSSSIRISNFSVYFLQTTHTTHNTTQQPFRKGKMSLDRLRSSPQSVTATSVTVSSTTGAAVATANGDSQLRQCNRTKLMLVGPYDVRVSSSLYLIDRQWSEKKNGGKRGEEEEEEVRRLFHLYWSSWRVCVYASRWARRVLLRRWGVEAERKAPMWTAWASFHGDRRRVQSRFQSGLKKLSFFFFLDVFTHHHPRCSTQGFRWWVELLLDASALHHAESALLVGVQLHGSCVRDHRFFSID